MKDVLRGVGLVWRRIEGCFEGGWVSLGLFRRCLKWELVFCCFEKVSCVKEGCCVEGSCCVEEGCYVERSCCVERFDSILCRGLLFL